MLVAIHTFRMQSMLTYSIRLHNWVLSIMAKSGVDGRINLYSVFRHAILQGGLVQH
jgi:hypothetical protein